MFNCTTNNFGTPKIELLLFLLIILIISRIFQAKFSGDIYDKRKKYSVPCSAHHGIYRGKSQLKQDLKFTLFVASLCQVRFLFMKVYDIEMAPIYHDV